ncbi:MAG: FtsK/SpoIIIE domain-containing protein, partial [Aquihabitans sp.]
GVIRDNLRANTNLRVALRMADEGDSDDVVGSDVAATFDPALPGRAVAKLGPGRLSPFQSLYVGGWTTGNPPEPPVRVSSFAAGTLVEWPEAEDEAVPEISEEELGANDLERVVDTIIGASDAATIAPPRKPWLPELEASYDLARPPRSEDDLRLISRTDDELIFGVLDEPADQAQRPVAFHPDRDGNMAVIGTGGSGKSAFLRTLAIAGALSTRGGPCHVYGLDFASRGLDMLGELPNVGSIITGDDDERVARLLQSLSDLIDERLARYAQTRSDTVSQYRERAGAPEEPRILLLVDGYPTFRQEYEISSRMRIYDLFQAIATNGRQAGVHVVVAADRLGAIPSALASVIQQRLVLRLSSDNEYSLAGVPADAFPTGTPPGRGYFNDREIQVAVLSGDPNTATQAESIARLAVVARNRGVAPAPEVGSLPDEVVLEDLPATVEGLATIGLADDDLGPAGIALDAPLLIAGPPKSGKATTIHTIIRAVQRTQPDAELLYIGEGRSWLARGERWDRMLVPGTEVEAAIDEILQAVDGGPAREEGQPPTRILVIEDANRVGNWSEADHIGVLAQRLADAGDAVIAEGETTTLGNTYGLLQVLKAAKTGLVLVPDQYDGESLFKTPFPKLSRADFPPGRGLYVRDGRARKVQVATSQEVRA